MRFDQTAAQRRRGLLILAGEVVFADGAADTIDGVERLAAGMQSFSLTPSEGAPAEDGLDLVRLVHFADRWEADHVPVLLLEHMADQIVLVQCVHPIEMSLSLPFRNVTVVGARAAGGRGAPA